MPVPEASGGALHDEVSGWVLSAARAADEKLGIDTIVLDVGEVLAIAGWFVITSGANVRQVRSIAEQIETAVGRDGGPKPLSVEGLDSLEWVLLDYGDFLVHVFERSTRAHYDLERLWSDAPRMEWAELTETKRSPTPS